MDESYIKGYIKGFADGLESFSFGWRCVVAGEEFVTYDKSVAEEWGKDYPVEMFRIDHAPKINIVCETRSNGVIGSTQLNVVRVDKNDDGSFSAVTDYWPQPDTLTDELAKCLQWMVDNDETNESDEPMREYNNQSWNQINEYWITGLNRARKALKRYEDRFRE